MAFYNSGERKIRPGVYMRIVNRGSDSISMVAPAPKPTPGGSDGDTKQIGDTLYIVNNVNAAQNGDVLVIE